MATQNDITGDSIQSKLSTDKFRSGWDKIDWNKKTQQDVMFNQHDNHAKNEKEVKDGSTD